MTDSPFAPPDDEIDWSETIDVAELTDIGRRRSNNQDSMRVQLAPSSTVWNRQGHLFLVADGMGAHAAGELASKMAVDAIPHYYYKFRDMPAHAALKRAFEAANSDIYRKGQSSFMLYSMGTTCSGLAILPEGAVAVHVGDSRVYQLDGEDLYQLTFDHSLVWEMQAAGRVSEEDLKRGLIPKNVITRSVGPSADLYADVEGPFPVRLGNRFLVCSDGLSGQIADEEIGAILLLFPPEKAARLFVDLSNLRGGPDNITAVVVEVKSERITSEIEESVAVEPMVDRAPFSMPIRVAAGACGVVALALLLLGYPWAAIASVVAGLLALTVGLVQIYQSRTTPEPPPPCNRYGKGPHRRFSARPTKDFFAELVRSLGQLREESVEKGWKIDWSDADQRHAAACQHADAKDYVSAIQVQADLILNLMDQIRSQEERDDKG